MIVCDARLSLKYFAIGISLLHALCRIRYNGNKPILPLTFGQHQFESAIHIVRIALVFSCVIRPKKNKTKIKEPTKTKIPKPKTTEH